MAGRAGRYVFLLLLEYKIYLLYVHEPILYAVFVFGNNERLAGRKAGSSVAYHETCSSEKMKKKEQILKELMAGMKWTRNCGVNKQT